MSVYLEYRVMAECFGIGLALGAMLGLYLGWIIAKLERSGK